MYLLYLLYWYRLSLYIVESLNVGISRQNLIIAKYFAVMQMIIIAKYFAVMQMIIIAKYFAVMQMINRNSLYSVAVRAAIRCDEVFLLI